MARTPKPDVEDVATPPAPDPSVGLEYIGVDSIDVGDNARTDLGDLTELAASIAARGVIQPIRVERRGDRWLLVFGQRRLAASKLAGRTVIPALVGPLPASDRTVEQLVENLLRLDLNPIDTARAYAALVDQGMKQKTIAARLGIGESSVSNALRLLSTDKLVQEKVAAGEISASHAKAIASLPSDKQRSIVSTLEWRVGQGKTISSHELERDLEWRLGEVEADKAKKAKTAAMLPKLAVTLAALPAGTPILVDVNGYTYDSSAILATIETLGYPIADAHRSTYDGSVPDGCTCTQSELVIKGKSAKLRTVCIVRSHAEKAGKVARQLDEAEHEAKRARIEAIETALTAILDPLIRSIDESTLRVLAECRTHSYDRPNVAKRSVDQIVAELAAVHVAYDVDPLAYLDRLGIADPVAQGATTADTAADQAEATETPKPKRTRRPTPLREPSEDVAPVSADAPAE